MKAQFLSEEQHLACGQPLVPAIVEGRPMLDYADICALGEGMLTDENAWEELLAVLGPLPDWTFIVDEGGHPAWLHQTGFWAESESATIQLWPLFECACGECVHEPWKFDSAEEIVPVLADVQRMEAAATATFTAIVKLSDDELAHLVEDVDAGRIPDWMNIPALRPTHPVLVEPRLGRAAAPDAVLAFELILPAMTQRGWPTA